MLVDRRFAQWTLAAIVVIGAVVRFHGLGDQSLWYDEAVSWTQSHGSILDLFRLTSEDNYPPLHNLLLFVTIHLFGDAEWSLRLPSAILGTLTIPLLYAITARLAGPVAGLFAALILALSGFHVWYSQEARMYALLGFTATLFAWVLLRYMTAPGPARHWPVWLAATALLYSHVFGSLTLVALMAGVWLVYRLAPNRWSQPFMPLIGDMLIGIVLFAPWSVFLLHQAQLINQQGFWIPYPTADVVGDIIVKFASGRIGLALLLVSCGAMVIAVATSRRTDTDAPAPKPLVVALVFLGLWALAPALLAFAGSLVARPFFISRYVIGSLPAVCALAGIGLTWLSPNRIAFGAVALGTVVVATLTLWTDIPPRDPWRDLAGYLDANLKAGDCLLAAPVFETISLSYYRRTKIPCQIFSDWGNDFANVPPTIHRAFAIIAAGNMEAPALARLTGWTRTEHDFARLKVFELTR
jgi:uncharacterized membrane protein